MTIERTTRDSRACGDDDPLTAQELGERVRPDFVVVVVGALVPDQRAFDVVFWRQRAETES